jgi:purine-binding chemotaxis protein CheW
MAAHHVATAGQYLTLRLGLQDCGIQILSVREINQISDIVEVPNTPAFVKGVINFRGKIIPVVDIKVKFGLPVTAFTRETCLVVIDCDHGAVGIIVDQVIEVIDLKENEIEQSPNFGCDENLTYLMGIGKLKNKILIILDVVQALSKDQFLKNMFINLEKLLTKDGNKLSV